MLSLEQVAKQLGMSKQSTSRVAARIGVGLVVNGRRVAYSAGDMQAIKTAARNSPGNPNMVAGSKHQKKASKAAVAARKKR